MLKVIDLSEAGPNYEGIIPRPQIVGDLPVAAVREIIQLVRDRGDEALFDLTKRFDSVDLSTLEATRDEIDAAYSNISPRLREALEAAAYGIEEYHKLELETPKQFDNRGIKVTHKAVPMARAGCYVPGGLARYPSSVLMTAIPAKVAGVREVFLVVPPTKSGGIDDATLAAAKIAGVDRVFKVGGAQAIAALAYGTQTIPKVDTIVGPGNVYVSVAKREVAGQVAIPSSFAGPSEVVVVADSSVSPKWAAMDVIVQAEHGPDGLAWLLTWDQDYALEVSRQVEAILGNSPRAEATLKTLREGGYAAIVRDRAQALEVANEIAPEHLELLYQGAEDDLGLVRNAGAVFYGPLSPASFGDYVAGPSHVLPTFGSARFASALKVGDFLKYIHFVEVSERGLDELGWAVECLAQVEGLYAHEQSIAIRRGTKVEEGRG